MTDEANVIALEVLDRVIKDIQDYIRRFRALEEKVDRVHMDLWAHLDPRVADALEEARKEED